MTNPGLDKYLRAIDRLHEEVKGRLGNLRSALVRGSDANKVATAKEAKTALSHLAHMFHDNDLPPWLRPISQSIDQFLASSQGEERDNVSDQLMSNLFTFKEAIYVHSLADRTLPPGFDFEVTYTEKLRASRIPELFDRLVVLLEQIIESGEIDSNKAITSLKALIALLKKNRTASYASAQWAWTFFCAASRSIVYRYTSESKALGPMVRGIEDAIKETNVEFDKVRRESADQAKAALRFDVPGLEHRPQAHGIAGPIVDVDFEATPKPDSPR